LAKSAPGGFADASLTSGLHGTNRSHHYAAIWLLGTLGEGAEQGVPLALRELAAPD
jgi:hypothetical protein